MPTSITIMEKRAVRERKLPPIRSRPADEQYAGAFARVRLVRAWIGAIAALVAMLYAFVALLDRVIQ